LRFHWSLHPEKAKGLWTDERGKLRSPWYDNECSRAWHPMDIAQELDIDYHASSAQFFDDSLIDMVMQFTRDPVVRGDLEINAETQKPERWVPMDKGQVLLWTPLLPSGDQGLPAPPEARYVAGVDVATGTGATPSTLSIARTDTGEKVLEIANATMKPHQWAAYCIGVCKWFHNAMLCWEINGPGAIFTETVLQIGYRNIYRRRSTNKMIETQSDKVGWHSSADTKKVLLGVYRKALQERLVMNYSRKALQECREYIFTSQGGAAHGKSTAKTTDASSARDNHGDRVIADAVMTMVLLEHLKRSPKGKVLTIQPQVGSLAHRRQDAERRQQEANSW
jgi:hypothetical protein